MPTDPYGLTDHERAICARLALSHSHRQICEDLGVSEKRVDDLRVIMCGKIGAKDVQGIVRHAYATGLIIFENGKWQ